MKKLATMLLAMMMLLTFAVVPAFAEEAAEPAEEPAAVDYSTRECYYFTEGEGIGFWLATVTLVGDTWETYSEENYVAATFTAAKPFSAIRVPYWAGNPNNFAGITPVDVEFAIFNAVENNWGSDYNSEDAVVREVKTLDCDDPEYVWEINQLPAGRYCIRFTQLTEEGGYIVIAQGEPADDDIEFDYENCRQNTTGQEGIALTVYYDETSDTPGDATTAPEEPTAAPTAAPTEVPTEAPTAAPTEAPTAAPTEKAAEPTAEPKDDNKDNTKDDNKGDKNKTWLIVGIAAGVILVAAVIAIIAAASKKKKKG